MSICFLCFVELISWVGGVVDAVAAGRSGVWPVGCLGFLSLLCALGFSRRFVVDFVFPRVYFIWRVF